MTFYSRRNFLVGSAASVCSIATVHATSSSDKFDTDADVVLSDWVELVRQLQSLRPITRLP